MLQWCPSQGKQEGKAAGQEEPKQAQQPAKQEEPFKLPQACLSTGTSHSDAVVARMELKQCLCAGTCIKHMCLQIGPGSQEFLQPTGHSLAAGKEHSDS